MSDDPAGARRKTLIGALFLAALLAIGLWVAQMISDRQALERCLASGRRDCGDLAARLPEAAPRSYVPSR